MRGSISSWTMQGLSSMPILFLLCISCPPALPRRLFYIQSLSPGKELSLGLWIGLADPGIFRFVSDVTPSDIGHLFSALGNPAYFRSGTRHAAIGFLVERLTEYYSDGRIIIRSNDFWTTQHSYWRLPSKAPELLADLEE